MQSLSQRKEQELRTHIGSCNNKILELLREKKKYVDELMELLGEIEKIE
ncbi:MAG: hypothetical protein ACTSWX_10710 [Promethearchaeota archaeon]